MRASKEEISLIIKYCIKKESELTEWEAALLYSIAGSHLRRELTEKQISKLQQIWERVTK